MYDCQTPNELDIKAASDYLKWILGAESAVHSSAEGSNPSDTVLLLLAPYSERGEGQTAHTVLYEVNPHLGQLEGLLDKTTKGLTITPVEGQQLSEGNLLRIQAELRMIN